MFLFLRIAPFMPKKGKGTILRVPIICYDPTFEAIVRPRMTIRFRDGCSGMDPHNRVTCRPVACSIE